MKYYKYGKPSGRKIGRIGNKMLYQDTISKLEEQIVSPVQNTRKLDFDFIYGPSTGGMIEPVLFKLSTPGEIINKAAADPYFKERDLKVMGRTVDDALLVVERINGVFAASHSLAFIGAVEDALGIEVGEKEMMKRIIEVELERIRSHLHVMARMTEPAAFGVPQNKLFYLRELASRLIGKYTGHRFFYGLNKIGHVPASFDGVSKELAPIIADMSDVYYSLLESHIFVDRLQGNGYAKEEESVGLVARSAGFAHDARSDSKSLPYSTLKFKPIVKKGRFCDSMTRFIVRGEEILQSAEIIGAAERLASGARELKSKKLSDRSGEGISRLESPSGDIAYLVKINNGKIAHLDMLASSQINLPVFERSTQGNVFTDFHFNWESFGIWISEIAVKMI